VGEAGRHEAVEELRLEMVCPKERVPSVLSAVRHAHPYEEPAVDVYPLEHCPEGCGIGRVGRLKPATSPRNLIARVKRALGLKKVLAAGPGALPDGDAEPVTTAACCAGSCGSTFQAAADAGATFYLTGEMRHHDALAAAEAGMTCVCVGHSHSERLVLHRLADRLAASCPKLAVVLTRSDRDPFEMR
jgi:putative NIF3 family GTP cyclohydrolase 1 type 2